MARKSGIGRIGGYRLSSSESFLRRGGRFKKNVSQRGIGASKARLAERAKSVVAPRGRVAPHFCKGRHNIIVYQSSVNDFLAIRWNFYCSATLFWLIPGANAVTLFELNQSYFTQLSHGSRGTVFSMEVVMDGHSEFASLGHPGHSTAPHRTTSRETAEALKGASDDMAEAIAELQALVRSLVEAIQPA
jgi:hypothetical protein